MWSIWKVAKDGESPICSLGDFLIFNQAKCYQYYLIHRTYPNAIIIIFLNANKLPKPNNLSKPKTKFHNMILKKYGFDRKVYVLILINI